jgi:hypothetical protein
VPSKSKKTFHIIMMIIEIPHGLEWSQFFVLSSASSDYHDDELGGSSSFLALPITPCKVFFNFKE